MCNDIFLNHKQQYFLVSNHIFSLSLQPIKKATENKQASKENSKEHLMTAFSPKKGSLWKASDCETCDVALKNLSLHLLETHRQLISLNYAQCFVAKNLATNKTNFLLYPNTT